MAKQKTIAIIHFNTPELTEACILSIQTHDLSASRCLAWR